jgi:hypothetical protein
VAEASVEVEVEADAVVGELDRGVVGPVVVPPEALHALIDRTAVIPQLIHFPVRNVVDRGGIRCATSLSISSSLGPEIARCRLNA